MKTTSRLLPCLLALGSLAPLSTTHAQGTVPATFDVSTVKPSAAGDGSMGVNWGNGALKAENVTLGWILPGALRARPDQLSGLPTWAKDKHFDITAKLTDTDKATLDKITPEQSRALMLALLVERFGLKYHLETKELPVYDLVPAKDGLKLTPAVNSGDKTKQVDGMCDGCSYGSDNEVKGHDIDMTAFVEVLAGQLRRDVHDKTGYTGKIDYKLKWAPALGDKPPSDEDAALPPLPQLLEKQMGLRLVPTRGPSRLYVIDHLEEPSAN